MPPRSGRRRGTHSRYSRWRAAIVPLSFDECGGRYAGSGLPAIYCYLGVNPACRIPAPISPWIRLVDVQQRIGAELEARLQEHAEILGLPIHRLGGCGEVDDVVLEVAEAMALHDPIAAAHADAQVLVHPIGQEGVELEAPAPAVLGDRPAEIAGVAADAQPMGVGAVEPGNGHPGGVDAEAEAIEVDRGIDA